MIRPLHAFVVSLNLVIKTGATKQQADNLPVVVSSTLTTFLANKRDVRASVPLFVGRSRFQRLGCIKCIRCGLLRSMIPASVSQSVCHAASRGFAVQITAEWIEVLLAFETICGPSEHRYGLLDVSPRDSPSGVSRL